MTSAAAFEVIDAIGGNVGIVGRRLNVDELCVLVGVAFVGVGRVCGLFNVVCVGRVVLDVERLVVEDVCAIDRGVCAICGGVCAICGGVRAVDGGVCEARVGGCLRP